MSQIRILAVEDNPIHAAKLEMLLDELGYFLIDTVNNTTDAVSKFEAVSPDIMLMDIDLKQDEDGIGIAKKITSINPVPIIFTTSFTDLTTIDRAKATHPFGYLIKPLEKAALQAAIELAVFRFAHTEVHQPEVQSSGWTQHAIAMDSFFVKTNCLEKVLYDDILWVGVSSDRYCEIVTESKTFTIRTSLLSLGEKLPPHQFVRIHRTYIVNIQKVIHINEQDMLIGIADQELSMGSAYKEDIMSRAECDLVGLLAW